MLELRPTCEHCNKGLPPESLEARICTYECTFCATCVDAILAMSARTAVVVLFLGQSDRRQIGKATTSLAKIRRVPRSSTGRLTLKLMPGSRPQSKTFRRETLASKVYHGQRRPIGIGISFSRLLFLLTTNTVVHYSSGGIPVRGDFGANIYRLR